MQRAMDETRRRRALQEAYNTKHGITPETIRKSIRTGIESISNARAEANAAVGRTDETQYITQEFINELEAEMLAAADSLEFERAAQLRDRIEQVQQQIGKPVDAVPERGGGGKRGKRGGGGGQRVPRPKRNA